MAGIKRNVYTVEQVNMYIKKMFIQDFLLNHVSVEGELSNCKYSSNGHIYFSIKDKSGVLSCVMFAGRRKGLNFKMADGQKVIVTGNISVFERDGKYQLYADTIEQVGNGELYKRFMQLKQELEDMGMFDSQYKRKIPAYAMSVGIVTAYTGSILQDILNVGRQRNPYVRFVLYPSKVQGEGAAESVVAGIRQLDAMGLDVIIIGRGGGSIEELWAFNEEIVARAIFDCQTPIISAVGHETDFTIADYAADLRASTPTHAAELAVFEYKALEEYLSVMEAQIYRRLGSKIRSCRNQMEAYRWKLDKLSPQSQIKIKQQHLQDIENRLIKLMSTQLKERQQQVSGMEDKLQRNMMQQLQNIKHQLAISMTRLDAGSPLKKLAAGYAYAEMKGVPVKSIQQISKGDILDITFADGKAKAKIQDITAIDG